MTLTETLDNLDGFYARQEDPNVYSVLKGELIREYPELSRQVRALIAENEQLKKCLDAERCPNCPDQGWFAVQIGGCDSDGENDTRESVQEQCQWCYQNENSLFNARKALEDGK